MPFLCLFKPINNRHRISKDLKGPTFFLMCQQKEFECQQFYTIICIFTQGHMKFKRVLFVEKEYNTPLPYSHHPQEIPHQSMPTEEWILSIQVLLNGKRNKILIRNKGEKDKFLSSNSICRRHFILKNSLVPRNPNPPQIMGDYFVMF